MSAQENLPTDLILEIISRLPSKSIARCRCLSKLWASTLASPYFTELFLTQSKTRPRLLFAIHSKEKWYLYSCPQPQMSYKNFESSLLVTAEFHMSLPENHNIDISTPISGLIYCPSNNLHNTHLLCNPATRRVFWLPQLTKKGVRSYFGYDPINKQFRVLAISYLGATYQGVLSSHQILKLGSERESWRNIKCPLHHYPLRYNTCIKGIFYYIAHFGYPNPRKIACFDLNCEEFKFIDLPPWRQIDFLVNFKGKLGGISKQWKSRINFEVSLWVLEDIEKQEWSKHVYLLPPLPPLWRTKFGDIRVMIGVTARDEIVVYLSNITLPFYVYFYNIEKNIFRVVEIRGFERFQFGTFLQGCVDYVEDLQDLNWS